MLMRLQEGGAAAFCRRPLPPLFAEPVAVAPDGEDVTVVEEAIEDCGIRHDGIAEDAAPLADARLEVIAS